MLDTDTLLSKQVVNVLTCKNVILAVLQIRNEY
jgi:hypothetical protein